VKDDNRVEDSKIVGAPAIRAALPVGAQAGGSPSQQFRNSFSQLPHPPVSPSISRTEHRPSHLSDRPESPSRATACYKAHKN
jgi:hypothetical protein